VLIPGAVLATVVDVDVPPVAPEVAPAVDEVWAADDEDAELPAFELLEQPDAATARTIATSGAHLRAEDFMSLPPLVSPPC
jgi:hypothetical protein